MVPAPSLGAGPISRLAPPAFPVAILTGTTASGKTAIALDFARKHGGMEIINADSLLVYRGFDIGTAKPTRSELAEIPHHLVDIRNPDEAFTAGDFVRECDSAIRKIHARGKRALIVGGTGFYLKALVYGLWDVPKAPTELREKLDAFSNLELHSRLEKVDAEAAKRITAHDRYRLLRAWEMIESTGKTPSQLEAEAVSRGSVTGLSLYITDRENADLEKRIAARTERMLQEGFVAEVEKLRLAFPQARPFEAVGYFETLAYLEGRKPAGRKMADGLPGLAEEIQLATRQLAKRQRTFFGTRERGQFTRVTDLRYFTLDRDRKPLEAALLAIYAKN